MSHHSVSGRLVRDAQARMCMGDAWVLMIELAPGRPGDAPVVATRQYGHGHLARQAATTQAHHLRAGQRCRVHCHGIGLGHTGGRRPQAAIELRAVDLIEPLDVPTRGVT